jgi:hypothetical protein
MLWQGRYVAGERGVMTINAGYKSFRHITSVDT